MPYLKKYLVPALMLIASASFATAPETFARAKLVAGQSPPIPRKGIVARANLFVAGRYGIRLSNAQRQLFLLWDKQFPPEPRELVWASRVAAIEGYRNPYITNRS